MKLFRPTIKLIQTIFWTIHYRMFLGKNYSQRVEDATNITRNLIDTTNGRVSHFHDIRGERIRGWHKHIKFNNDTHPLVKRYS